MLTNLPVPYDLCVVVPISSLLNGLMPIQHSVIIVSQQCLKCERGSCRFQLEGPIHGYLFDTKSKYQYKRRSVIMKFSRRSVARSTIDITSSHITQLSHNAHTIFPCQASFHSRFSCLSQRSKKCLVRVMSTSSPVIYHLSFAVTEILL